MPEASLQTFFCLFVFLTTKTSLLERIPRLLTANAATFLCAHETSGEMSRINQQEMRKEVRRGVL